MIHMDPRPFIMAALAGLSSNPAALTGHFEPETIANRAVKIGVAARDACQKHEEAEEERATRPDTKD